jgi:hypothetical protein
MGEHMPRFIPGNPKFVVTNQPGANSLLAWQSVMRKTPGTGLDIAVFTGGLITQTVLGEKLESFELDTPIYIGAPDNAPRRSTVCVRTDIADSLDAFLKSPRKLRIAEAVQATGPGANKMWLEIVGLPVQPVFGYGGTSELNAAFDRGELELTDRCNDATLVQFPDWLGQNQATPLFYFENPPQYMQEFKAQGRAPWLGHVADVVPVTPDQRAALEANNELSSGERLFALPPRTPDNIVAAIRKGFNDTVNDPAFQAEMERRNLDVGLKSADALKETIEKAQRLKPEVFSILKQMYTPKT